MKNMRKFFGWTFAVLLFFAGFNLIAQPNKPKKKLSYKGKTIWSDGETGSGKIDKQLFDSLFGQKLFAIDSNGSAHTVISFSFVYSERGIFEDSTGKLRIMTENYSIHSNEGTFPPEWISEITRRTKKGDTAYFTNVVSSYDETGKFHFHSEPLKLIIEESK